MAEGWPIQVAVIRSLCDFAFHRSHFGFQPSLLSLQSLQSLPCLLASMRAAPSMIWQGAGGALLWAGGAFRSMDEWAVDNRIDLLINLLGTARCRGPEWIEWNMEDRGDKDWVRNLRMILIRMTSALYSGKQVLVHCLHGVRLTGSLVTVWFAVGKVAEQDGDRDVWHKILEEAWQIWSRGRQLRQASREGRRRRDYEAESWNAVKELFFNMPVGLVAQLAGDWKEAQQLAESVESVQSMQSAKSKKKLQPPPLVNPSSSSSSTLPMPKQSGRSHIKRLLDDYTEQSETEQSQQSQSDRSPSSPTPSSPRPSSPRLSLSRTRGRKREAELQLTPRVTLRVKPTPPEHVSLKSRPDHLPPPTAKEIAQQVYGPKWVPGAEWKDGDWVCRSCGNHNWRFRGFCNRNTCKCPRDILFLVGKDWYCKKCGNFNKQEQDSCNKQSCGLPRRGNEQSP